MTSADLFDGLRDGALRWPWARALVRLRGPDARRFANNMFTNNVRDLPVGAANRHAMTDDRGRVQGFLDLLCEADDQFLAVLDTANPEPFLTRFETYIVFDDVEMTVLDGLRTAVVVGARSAERLEALGVEIPQPGNFLSYDGGFVWRQSLGAKAVEAVALALPDLAVLDAMPMLSEATETLVRVITGQVQFPDDTGPKTLPHELGLRDVVLNFDKGCYLGQETINRVDVMGQVKRHLRAVLVRGTADADADVTYEGKVVGRLTSPVQLTSPAEVTLGFVIVRAAAADPGTRVDIGGTEATVLEIPVSAEQVAGE